MKLADLAHALGAELLGPALHASPPPDSEASSAAPPTHRIPAQEGHYASTDILGVAGIEDAQPHQLTFVANPKYVALAQTTRAGAILVEPGFPAVPLPTLRLSDPYYAFARALELFYQPPSYPPGIHATAVVDPSAIIGDNVHIGPFAVVGPDVVLGADSVLLAHVVLYPGAHIGTHFFAHAHAVVREHCILGDHVTLQNGAIIGADGFGFAKSPRRSPDNNPGPCSNAHAENASDGNLNASPARGQAHSQQASALPGENRGAWFKIPQSGPVILEDWVEVQAHACIDRASVGETRIGRGAKIDNLVQVGHGSTVGAGTLLCAQVGLAGSSHIGNNVILAGQVGVAGHCTIGDGAIATAQSGIPGDVAPGAIVSGYPAIDNRRWLKASAIFQRLPETLRKLQKARKSEEA